jgi:hypothetical protein
MGLMTTLKKPTLESPGFMDTVRDYETHPGVTPEYSAQRA